MKNNGDLCPCRSGKIYGECCGAVLSGGRQAATAEELMRARYTAYAVGDVQYLYKSSGSEVRAEFDANSAREWSRQAEWGGIEVVRTEKGGTGDAEGVVEFIAHYTTNGKACDHHETAVFKKIDGEWRFIDGEIEQPAPVASVRREEPKIGRNDPCPCGSGKKFKKCDCAKYHGTK